MKDEYNYSAATFFIVVILTRRHPFWI